MKIQIDHLHHRYQSSGLEPRTVLSIDHWLVEPAAQILLRGVSGSGKTTLFNILAGLLQPSTGTLLLDQQNLYTLPEAQRDRWRARYVGYVFQMHLLVPNLSAQENIEMALVFAGTTRPGERTRRAREILDQVGLADFARHRPAQLSMGQRLRVSIARALVNRPSLLLADEPTAALDSEAGNLVMELMQQICREHNATLLVASHDPALGSRFAQTIFLRNGRIEGEGT